MPERSPIARNLMRYLPQKPHRWWQGFLVGGACSLLAYLLRVLIDPFVMGVPFVTFFPFIVVATFWAGCGPA